MRILCPPLLLLLAPTSGLLRYGFFKYTSPQTNKSLSLCICAKCGSTSIFEALHRSILGRPFPAPPKRTSRRPPLGPFVQRFHAWGADGVTRADTPGDVHFHVVRDPIERYVSAFHSKLRCCPGVGDRPCMKDEFDPRVGSLLRLVGNSSKRRCLHFADYALALRAASRMGLQAELDGHYLPQTLSCPRYDSSSGLLVVEGDAQQLAAAVDRVSEPDRPLVLRGNVSVVAPALERLPGYGFKGGPLAIHAAHGTERLETSYRRTPFVWRALCEVSRPEYRRLELPMPRECGVADPKTKHKVLARLMRNATGTATGPRRNGGRLSTRRR
jgi:hypothetical protein